MGIDLSRKEIIRHSIIWLLITIYFSIVDPPTGPIFYAILITSMVMINYMIVYYSFYLFIFPRFYKKDNKAFIFWGIISFLIFQAFTYLNFYYIVTLNGEPSVYANEEIYALALNFTIYFVIILITAFPAYQKKVNIEKMKEQGEREKALLLKNLGFYKNQFNEHITFNFLNYCYSFIHKDSKEGAETIELFSSILRHSLNNKSDEPVLLATETQYISDFITLHKKLDNEIQVKYETVGDIEGKFIFPRILITFIENAFKHGNIHDQNNPITIKVESKPNVIGLYVQNRKKNNEGKLPSTGIGYYNVKQQLDLFYKDRHTLSYFEKNDYYFCELLINY